MSYERHFPVLTQEDKIEVFDLDRWDEACLPQQEPVHQISRSYGGMFDTVRRKAALYIPALFERIGPTEQLVRGTTFLPEAYPTGTVFDFSVSYLKRETRFNQFEGTVTRELAEPAKPDLIVAGDHRPALSPSVTANFRMIERVAGWQTEDASYANYQWSAIVLKSTDGKKHLMGLLEDKDDVALSLFPRHDPAKIGFATKITKLADAFHGQIDTYEYIDWVNVYEQPVLWGLFLQEKEPPKSIGQFVTNLRAQLARSN